MSEEEKKVIKLLKEIEDIRSCTIGDDLDEEDAKIILNLIEKQQKELDKKDKIIKEIAKALVNHVGTSPADYSGDLEEKCEKCYEKEWELYMEEK